MNIPLCIYVSIKSLIKRDVRLHIHVLELRASTQILSKET